MSKSENGTVLALFMKERESKRVKEIEVDEGGIIGDKYYEKEGRSVLFSEISSYTLAQSKSIELNLGDLGENLVVDAKIYTLGVGEKFKVGDVIFEITMECTLCKGLAEVDKRLPSLLKKSRGVFAKVISKYGKIKENDYVIIDL